ncbi:MAG: phosphoribosylglycinamide formyltransferase [Gammaproteobacteria bacterium]|nr:phosphoribosylglycinamide formyltransferase [Gammaproteobacteria bacterium]MDH5592817.1 phosphoribosylglycinamide formyltransferase [Gammaproteobacteria bacterium]
MTDKPTLPLPIVVLISGSGTNLQAIIDYVQSSELPVTIRAVISNRADAKGIERAQKAHIPVEVVNHNNFPDRDSFDKELMKTIDQYQPKLVVLAGFMRVLTDDFVNHYHGRMMNIHPSLLPKYRGLNTHHRVLEAGEKEHGASVQFVTAELDAGPVIVQSKVPVLEDDTPELLAERVHKEEHQIYPLAILWFAEGKLKLQDNKVVFNGHVLEKPITPDA